MQEIFRRSFTDSGAWVFGIGVTDSTFQAFGLSPPPLVTLKILVRGKESAPAALLTSLGKMSPLTVDLAFFIDFSLFITVRGSRTGLGLL